MKRSYAVIGAGNGGQAMAAHLSLMGYDVSLYDNNCEKIAQLQRLGTITATGRVEGVAQIFLITSRLDRAIAGRTAIFVATTTDQQIVLAESLLSCIADGQIVVLCPGQMGGSVVMHNFFARHGKTVVVAEMQDLIYTCRASEAGRVHISALKRKMALAAYEKDAYPQVIHAIGELYPQLTRAKSVLHTGFSDMGAILHPAPMLMNAGRIESGGDFLYYREGITPAVASVLEQLDRERLAVAAAYGVEVPSIAQWQKEAYGVEGNSLYELFQNNSSYAAIKAGATLNSRFISEDVPSGLVPITALGAVAGVSTPMMESVIELACGVLHCDFRAEGRNLRCMGLEGKTVADIQKLFL